MANYALWFKKGLWIGCCSPLKKSMLVNFDYEVFKLHVVFASLSYVTLTCMIH